MNRLEIELTFRLKEAKLPTLETQYQQLWHLALILERSLGMPLEAWHPPADTPELSRQYAAFDRTGPTAEGLAMVEASNDDGYDEERIVSAWNGVEEMAGGAVLSSELSVDGVSSVEFSAADIAGIENTQTVMHILIEALKIWPSLFATVGTLTTRYFGEHQVFKDRPPAGWMLYLPQVLTTAQVPEARALIPVWDQHLHQQGTIIASVIDGPFDIDNPEHVRIANAIEIRLVDQDLLPTYASLVY